jgi:hypothetical protein
VVAAVVDDGQMDPRRAKEFGRLLDDLAKAPDRKGNKKDDDEDVGEQMDDLSEYLSDLVEEGQLTPDGFRRIDAALARL